MLYPGKVCFKNEGEIKTFPKAKPKRNHCQLTHLPRNSKGSSLGRTHVNPDRNSNQHEKTKTTSKGNYVIIEDSIIYKCIWLYLFSLNLLKMQLYKTICILSHCWAYNIQKWNIFSTNSLKEAGKNKAALEEENDTIW